MGPVKRASSVLAMCSVGWTVWYSIEFLFKLRQLLSEWYPCVLWWIYWWEAKEIWDRFISQSVVHPSSKETLEVALKYNYIAAKKCRIRLILSNFVFIRALLSNCNSSMSPFYQHFVYSPPITWAFPIASQKKYSWSSLPYLLIWI